MVGISCTQHIFWANVSTGQVQVSYTAFHSTSWNDTYLHPYKKKKEQCKSPSTFVYFIMKIYLHHHYFSFPSFKDAWSVCLKKCQLPIIILWSNCIQKHMKGANVYGNKQKHRSGNPPVKLKKHHRKSTRKNWKLGFCTALPEEKVVCFQTCYKDINEHINHY